MPASVLSCSAGSGDVKPVVISWCTDGSVSAMSGISEKAGKAGVPPLIKMVSLSVSVVVVLVRAGLALLGTCGGLGVMLLARPNSGLGRLGLVGFRFDSVDIIFSPIP